MKKKAIAITHVGFENLGTLEAALEQADYAIEAVDACTADLRAIDPNADLLVVLGGPIGVYGGEA